VGLVVSYRGLERVKRNNVSQNIRHKLAIPYLLASISQTYNLISTEKMETLFVASLTNQALTYGETGVTQSPTIGLADNLITRG